MSGLALVGLVGVILYIAGWRALDRRDKTPKPLDVALDRILEPDPDVQGQLDRYRAAADDIAREEQGKRDRRAWCTEWEARLAAPEHVYDWQREQADWPTDGGGCA